MDELPANQKLRRKDAFYSLALAPLEYVTASLRKGDPWELADLTPFVNRCAALVAAYEDRMKAAREDQ
jgi:hypothetical protein